MRAVTLLFASVSASLAGAALSAHPVTIPDSIESTEVGQELAGIAAAHDPIAIFSPDHLHFLVVTHRGNLRQNTNDYSLQLFESDQAFARPRGRLLVTMSTSTNNPGISQLRWLADNQTALFVGCKDGGYGQIYSIDVHSAHLRQLTHEPAGVTEFDTTGDMRTIVFKAKHPVPIDFGDAAKRDGIVVSTQTLGDLVAGRPSGTEDSSIYVWRRGQPAKKVEVPSNLEPLGGISGLSLSPDGAYAVINSFVRDKNKSALWQYKDPATGDVVIMSYTLIDTLGAASRLVLNAPVGNGLPETAVWSADSKSLLAVAYSPADLSSVQTLWRYETPTEVAAHLETPSVLEMNVQTGTWNIIARGRCVIDHWNPADSTIFLKTYEKSVPAGIRSCNSPGVYRKINERWTRVAAPGTADVEPTPLKIEMLQDINVPPQIFAVDLKTGKQSMLLDLNPQYHSLNFGEVREIEFQGFDGVTKGGLYYPVGYRAGQRYPLVIQTHGWQPHRFAIDGYATAGYAAQTLAGTGFMVAQIAGNPHSALDTPKEAEGGMVVYQNLIESLEKQGLIDPQRVGIQTWSRTGLTARYTLVFSKYPIAAGIIVDAFDPGYFSYMAHADIASQTGNETTEAINGGPPFGEHLQQWLDRVPDFNLQHVRTPVLQFSFERDAPLGMWEFFAGLKLLHKPIEYVHLPSSNHWPVRPTDRIAVQQRSVDWFRFWLQGYERAQPIEDAEETSQHLREQYARWEKLCDMQVATESQHPTFCVGTKH